MSRWWLVLGAYLALVVTALAFVLWYSAVAWRRVFAAMRLKPTQYRCAAEQLLRRLRLDGALPSIHPLVDLGNATSAARSLPIAVLDLDQVVGEIVVRPASGMESYVTFGGEVEHPLAG